MIEGKVLARFLGTVSSAEKLVELASITNEVKGDIVECGVAYGGGIAIMSKETSKNIWCYDSYEGIQLASDKDDQQAGIGAITHDVNGDLLRSSNVTVCSLEGVKSNLLDMGCDLDRFKFVKGWVQNTIPEKMPESISLLRLDMDIYDATLHALKHLFPLLTKGGVFILDDGNLKGCVDACNDYFNSINYTPEWQSYGENPIYFII
jgi:hypothetical protein